MIYPLVASGLRNEKFLKKECEISDIDELKCPNRLKNIDTQRNAQQVGKKNPHHFACNECQETVKSCGQDINAQKISAQSYYFK